MAAMPSESHEPDPRTVKRAKKQVRIKKSKTAPTHHKKKLKRNPAEVIAIHRKQEQALELRMTGATYQVIADALGYANPSSAKAAVDSCIWRAEKDAAKEVVALDLARLDEYQMRCTHKLRTDGDLHQIDRLMRIMEMRYRLLGISDETVRAMQENHGIVNVKGNMVMNIHQAPETEVEFISKMMRAQGIDPESKEAKKFLSVHDVKHELPMLKGSANEGVVRSTAEQIEDGEIPDDDDVVEAEIVEEM